MPTRLDSKIYQSALKILRERHEAEFHDIRKALLEAAGIEIKYKEPTEARFLTRQKELDRVYAHIVRVYTNVGYCPSMYSINNALKLGSREHARKLLNILIEDGKLIRIEHGQQTFGVGNYVIADPTIQFSET